MEKYSLYPGRDASGRPNVHLVEPGTAYGLNESSCLEKTASGEHLPEVMELVASLQPQSDRLYLVNSALGAGEYVGFNLRGDWFTEKGLLHTPPGWDDIPVWDIDARRQAANWTEHVPGWGELCWGYPTFYNAHRFRHHQNKDPNRAYGYVLGAFWDPRMHRVILVSELIKDMCRNLGAMDLYERISRGDFPDTSMGAKVPHDRCSICGQLSKNPSGYCKHCHKNAMPPYGMRSILPDGRMCGVYNDQPRFFDDSYVFIGAERSAKVMSDVTGMVAGQRGYTQNIYPYTPPMQKAAAMPSPEEDGNRTDAERSPSEERDDTNLSDAARKIFAIPTPDDTLEAKLERLISGLPLSNPKEREILRYLQTKQKTESRFKSGDLSERESKLVLGVEKRRLKHIGVTEGDIKAVENKMRARETDLVNEKTSSIKWAEILKHIPAPSPEQLSVVNDHDAQMPDLPDHVLDFLGEDPGPRIRACSHLGVVLRPREFQYALLKKMHPEEAQDFHQRGAVFRSEPPPLSGESAYNPLASTSSSLVQELAGMIGDFLMKRSLAPAAVRIRMVKSPGSGTREEVEEQDHPLLEKVSSLYNEYRGGLLARTPDWRYVPVGYPPLCDLAEEEKLASASQKLSNDLLRLASWPALPVG